MALVVRYETHPSNAASNFSWLRFWISQRYETLEEDVTLKWGWVWVVDICFEYSDVQKSVNFILAFHLERTGHRLVIEV